MRPVKQSSFNRTRCPTRPEILRPSPLLSPHPGGLDKVIAALPGGAKQTRATPQDRDARLPHVPESGAVTALVGATPELDETEEWSTRGRCPARAYAMRSVLVQRRSLECFCIVARAPLAARLLLSTRFGSDDGSERHPCRRESRAATSRPAIDLLFATCGSGRRGYRPEVWSVSESALLSGDRGYDQVVDSEPISGLAFACQEVSPLRSDRPRISPL